MNDTKQWYQSKGVWGAVIALAATGLGAFFHLSLTADQQSQLVDAAVAIGGAAGSIVAVWGRVTATTTIGAN